MSPLHEFTKPMGQRTPGEKPGLTSLPYDLLLNIASCLELDDIHNLHLVCRSLHDFAQARPVYRKLATDLLRRCRALPLKGFQQITDLSPDQLMYSVNKATRYERAWSSRAPYPIRSPPRSNYMDGERQSWYKVISAPPGEDVDWLSPITSSYTLCATKRGKVVCWDVQRNLPLAEWNPGQKWELWKCRVEFEQRAVYFTMAKLISGHYDDGRIMEFILMRLTFSDGPSGETSKSPPTFSRVTDFRTTGVVMNVFLLDPQRRLLSAFVWVSATNTIGLFTLPDWDKREYVFIDTGIDCINSSNWSCILFEDHIVIHCEESDAAYQHFYPLPFLRKYIQPLPNNTSAPVLSYVLRPPRTITRRFRYPVSLHHSIDEAPTPSPNGIHVNGTGAASVVAVGAPQTPPTNGNGVYISNTNPYPVPPWFPESAHFVRQWWPTLPGIPRVSCTVVLLASSEIPSRRCNFILAQHYFRVPLNHYQWMHPEACKCGSEHHRKECVCTFNLKTIAEKARAAQDDALMNMWYVSMPFDVVRVLDAPREDEEPDPDVQERPRPLVAVDFGHAVWIEYVPEGDVPTSFGDDESDPKRLRFVTFPKFKDETEFAAMEERGEKWAPQPGDFEGKVRTLEVPEELDLGNVETINIDQSQGAVILSDREGKIYILCYE